MDKERERERVRGTVSREALWAKLNIPGDVPAPLHGRAVTAVLRLQTFRDDGERSAFAPSTPSERARVRQVLDHALSYAGLVVQRCVLIGSWLVVDLAPGQRGPCAVCESGMDLTDVLLAAFGDSAADTWMEHDISLRAGDADTEIDFEVVRVYH